MFIELERLDIDLEIVVEPIAALDSVTREDVPSEPFSIEQQQKTELYKVQCLI